MIVSSQPAAPALAPVLREDLFESWIAYIDGSTKTVETYTKSIKQFMLYVAENGIAQPSREDIIAYRDHLKATGKKPTTVQSYLAAVKLFFKWTDQSGLYPNVADHVKGAKIDTEQKKDYLTTSQSLKLLEGVNRSGLKGKRDYAIMAKDLVSLMKGENVEFVPVTPQGQEGTGKVGTASGGQEQIIAYAVDHFVQKGYTPEQAAGIVGNLIREGLLTKDYGNEYADGSGPSAGIAGFHSYYNGAKGELDHLKAYASKTGKNWKDLGTQLDYLTEGSTAALKALGKIKNATTVSDSAKIWGHDYERFRGYDNYENQNYKNRISSGHDALSIYNKNKGNISDMASSQGVNGGAYKPGNYSAGFND